MWLLHLGCNLGTYGLVGYSVDAIRQSQIGLKSKPTKEPASQCIKFCSSSSGSNGVVSMGTNLVNPFSASFSAFVVAVAASCNTPWYRLAKDGHILRG